ncbi:MAG: nodulation protein NodH [Cereibacter sphaeroides]|uniref:Nodulation protein NodH n=1 Tax=Cereibacter sphaeroides TaxID=1063 RepID=A0A2W5U356_CERSP|nr:MAG: nodulation protein NodH [Cereibacter sphaeroides]
MARFDSFVMLAGMRTGSNLLEAALNGLPGVICHGEVFNPHFIGKKDQMEFLGLGIAQRDADPLSMLHRLHSAGSISGFRLFRDHDPRILDTVLADPRCAKIVLTRNPVESYVSWKIAKATDQWKLTNPRNLKTATAAFDAAEFGEQLAATQQYLLRIQRDLQLRGQTAFYLDYEDIGDLAVLNGLAAFLGVPALDAMPEVKLKKQNPDAIEEKVSNPAEMAAALARVDWPSLGRTPNFEPRRGAALAAMRVASGAPLVFMPVRGGPEAEITDWLAGFGGGVESNFSQKDLRQWKRAHPGHRSFTVLRHPVARAHAVFCDQVLTDRMAEVRKVLIRQHEIDLLPPGQIQPLADHRAAFLGFLRFIRLNLAGQSNLRVDPHWASQTAIVQGFAQVQSPDVILRETELDRDLPWLAAFMNREMPVFMPGPAIAPHFLAEVYDDEVEAAARDAYQRDYIGFGFGRWR